MEGRKTDRKTTKVMKKYISLIAVLVLSWGNIVAQDVLPIPPEPPTFGRVSLETMPVWSPDVARLYALSQVRSGRMGIHCRTMSDQQTEVVVSGDGAEDVIRQLSEVEFNFEVLNPEDWVSLYVTLTGDDGGISLLNGSYVARAKDWVNPHVDLTVSSIPVLSGVESAELLILNSDGTTWNRQNVWVGNGRVIVDGWMMGVPNGTLVVRFQDGRVRTYRLGSPDAGTDVDAVKGRASSIGLANHFAFTDPTLVILVVSERPTISLTVNTVTESGIRDVTFNILGIDWRGEEKPTSIFLVDKITDQSIEGISFPMHDGVSSLGLPAGQYQIFFIWDQFGSKEPLYTGGGGGKG